MQSIAEPQALGYPRERDGQLDYSVRSNRHTRLSGFADGSFAQRHTGRNSGVASVVQHFH